MTAFSSVLKLVCLLLTSSYILAEDFVVTYPDGSVYTGEINAEEMRHGRGVMKYSTGEVYTGDWRWNRIEGHGIMEDQDGGYEGDWSNDEHHGFGTKRWVTAGTIYRGDWFEGKIQGNGWYLYEDGVMYEGEWFNNLRHGRGEMRDPENKPYERGIYENDELVTPEAI